MNPSDPRFWPSFQASDPTQQTSNLCAECDGLSLQDALYQAQAELEGYRTLYESLPSIYFTLDNSGIILRVNQFGATCLGYQPADLMAQSIFCVSHPEDHTQLQLELTQCGAEPQKIAQWDMRFMRQDQQILWVRVSAKRSPAPQIAAPHLNAAQPNPDSIILLICEDITEQKQAEAQYLCDRSQEAEEREKLLAELENKGRLLEAVLHQMPAGVMIAEAPSGRLLLSNWQVSQILQRPTPMLTSLEEYTQLQGFYADGTPYTAEDWPLARALRHGEVITDEEINFLRDDRSVGTMHVSAAPIRDREGEIIAGVATFHNVTERQQAEAALRQSEERFRQMAENIREIFWMSSPERQQILYISPAYEVIWGRTCQSLYLNPDSFFEAIHPQDQARVRATIDRQSQGEYDEEYRIVQPSGKIRWIRDRAFPVQDRSGKVYRVVGVAQDITDQREAQDFLQHQAERERLVSAIAKRIRQSLNLESTLKTTVAEVRQFLQTDRVIIYRFQPNGDGMVVVESVAQGWRPIAGTVVHDRYFAESYVQLYLQGRVQAIDDIYTANLTPCHTEMLASFQVRANLVVPIVQENMLWGLLVAQQCRETRRWQPIEIDLLKQLATQAAIAIQQSELYQQAQHELNYRQRAEAALRQQVEREHLIGAIAQRIRQSLDLEEILNTTVAEVRQFLQADRVLIYRIWPNGTGSAVTESVVAGWPQILGRSFPEEVFPLASQQQYSQGRTLAIDDIDCMSVPSCLVEFVHQFGVKAKLVVPILQDQSLWGLLVAHHCSDRREWQGWEVEFLKQLATQVGIAIKQSELYRQVQLLNTNLEQQVHERTAQLQRSLDFAATLQRITDKVRDSLDERQILQTAVQELTNILQAAYCYAALYNSERTVATINYEYSSAPIGSALGQVIPILQNPKIHARLLAGKAEQGDRGGQLVYPHLAQRLISRLLSPIFDNLGAIGYLGVFHQGHYRFSEMELQLVQQVANQCAIAIRQARLYQTAQHQVEELEKVNRLKDDFLSTVSHELRTPVTNMKMATQMLAIALNQEREFLAEMAKPKTERSKVARYFQILHDECEREISLINDLLDLQRLDAGVQPLAREAIHLQDWLPRLVEPFQERIHNHQQTLKVEIAPNLQPLLSDASSLNRALCELVNNACKYTPAHEQIAIAAKKVGDRLQLTVSNSGAEIPAHELPRVFDKFYRVPSTDPWRQGGTGLGLALVKKLIEHLGGQITVTSDAQGTCFTLDLPLGGEQFANKL